MFSGSGSATKRPGYALSRSFLYHLIAQVTELGVKWIKQLARFGISWKIIALLSMSRAMANGPLANAQYILNATLPYF